MKQLVKMGILGSTICLGLAMLASTPVLAADDITISRPHRLGTNASSNFYVGANLGYSKYKVVDDSTAAYGLFGGYHINEVLAVDVSWTDLGEASDAGEKSDASLLQLGMMGKVPVRTDLTLFGKIGLAMWDYDFSDPISSYNDSNTDAFIGFGADYSISGQSAVRFGLDFYSMKPDFLSERDNISEFSIGILFRP